MLNLICKEAHKTAVDKGFWDDGYTHYVVGTKLALIHSEVTEILEAIRKQKPTEELSAEFADVLIRLCDLYAAMEEAGDVTVSLEDAVTTKMSINAGRPFRHGNLY